MLDQESPALRGFFVKCVTKQAIFISNYVAVFTMYLGTNILMLMQLFNASISEFGSFAVFEKRLSCWRLIESAFFYLKSLS
jgi:hypothetical protein